MNDTPQELNDPKRDEHDTKEVSRDLMLLAAEREAQLAAQSEALEVPALTHEELRMLIKFKEETEQRLRTLLTVEEIQKFVDDIVRAVLQDRPTTEEVMQMVEAVRASERQQIDFILTSAIESVKKHGELVAQQNTATAERLTRENGRMVQTMQNTFAVAMEESRRANKEVVDDAKALVNQHAGSIAFLQTIVAEFNKRTDAINTRVDDYANKYAQAVTISSDTEQRLVEFIQPFQGESGFIALVRQQSKVIEQQERVLEAQQKTAELRQRFFKGALEVIKRPEFWIRFGGGATGVGATIVAIGKALGLF